MQNHYVVMGLRGDADEVVISAAFRSLSKKYHPDTSGSANKSNVEKFRKIKDAYEVLRDPEKRRRFDEQLAKAKARTRKQQTENAQSSNQRQDSNSKQSKEGKNAKTAGLTPKPTPTSKQHQPGQIKRQSWVWITAIVFSLGGLLLIAAIGNFTLVRPEIPSHEVIAKPSAAPSLASVNSENKSNLEAIQLSTQNSSKINNEHLPDEQRVKQETPDVIVGNASEKGEFSPSTEQNTKIPVPRIKSTNNSEADNHLRDAAKQGDVSAMVALGVMDRDGLGMPQNYAEALILFQAAADRGDTDATFYLGSMYGNGQGVPKDFTKAVRLYATAAVRGHKLSLSQLTGGEVIMDVGSDVNGKTFEGAVSDFKKSNPMFALLNASPSQN